MEIYINTAKQPPSLSADANGLQATTFFEFKRGTTVPLKVYVPAAVAGGIARLRYGLKLKGRYDAALTVLAETSDAGEETPRGVPFELKATFDAATIDAALAANAESSDDVADASFISEFAWENEEGEVTATRTVSTKISNNVIRRGDGSEGDLPRAQYTALMVVKIRWADYLALEEKRDDVIYFVPDAPSEVEEHDASADAHAKLFDAVNARIDDAELLARDAVAVPASTSVAGVVKLSHAAVLTSADAPVGTGADGALRVPLGGQGVFLDSSNRLTLALRDTAPGLAFGAARKLGVALRDQSTRPTAGNVAPVLADSAGNLCVPDASAAQPGAVYLPESEASGLTSAAASLELLRTKATASSVACGATASSENCNQYSFVGPLSALGVTGAAADLNSVTFYRRGNATPNGDTQVYLRLLKKTVGADGTAAWQIASQSVNAVAFSAQTENGGKCGTFYMRRVAGVEPPTCAETVALVMVGAADAEVTAGLQFGCKVAASETGGVCLNWGLDLSITLDKGNMAMVPLVDVTWTPCAPAGTPTAAEFAALVARVAALESANG